MASQYKVVPEKIGVPQERETEERGSQDDVIETESEVDNKQQLPPPVGAVRPVPPSISTPPPLKVRTVIMMLILTIIILHANIMYNLIILVIEDYRQQSICSWNRVTLTRSVLRNSCLVCKSYTDMHMYVYMYVLHTYVLFVGIRDDCLTSLTAETKTGQARSTGTTGSLQGYYTH